MNKHVSPDLLSDPALTPAERVTALMDAFVKHQQLSQATDAIQKIMDEDEVDTKLREDLWDRRDEAIHADMDASDGIVAHLKILIGGGILERCVGMLEAETPTALAERS